MFGHNSSPSHKRPLIMGRIHANWCGHCKTLGPEWKKMQSKIDEGVRKGKYHEPEYKDFESDEISKGKLNDFNSENSKYLNGDKIVFSGFPTIYKIQNGKIDYYSGARESGPMEEWFMTNNRVSKNESQDISHEYNSKMKHRSKMLRSRSVKNFCSLRGCVVRNKKLLG